MTVFRLFISREKPGLGKYRYPQPTSLFILKYLGAGRVLFLGDKKKRSEKAVTRIWQKLRVWLI
jgi:hypothetical protein